MTQAHLLLHGGTIWLGRNLGQVEALAIRDGRVIAAGDRAHVADACGPTTRRLDLQGGFALPAFNDPHMHLATLGFSLGELDLRGISRDQLLASVRDAARQAAPGAWISGRGYEESAMGGVVPGLAELDAASPDHPVLLRRVCGHQFLANSAALRLAGIDDSTADPSGGVIVRDNGHATGRLLEEAGQLIVRAMPRPTEADFAAAVTRAAEQLASQGIASVMDAAVGRAGYDELAALLSLARADALPLRTWVCLYAGDGGVLERAHAEGLRFGTSIGSLRFGAAKLFADGSVGGGTAAFSAPYVDGSLGLLSYSTDEMHARLRRLHDLGYQLAIHAIGDSAIEQVLAGIEALPEAETAGRRHRIEHCGFATADQIRRMRSRAILPVPQPALLQAFGDRFAELLGRPRVDTCYPMRLWREMGLDVSASSDAPICSSAPMVSIAAMLRRRTASGTVYGAGQCLDIDTALDAQTRAGAVTQFAEAEIGTLAVGMQADIAVLSEDPRRPEAALERIETLATLRAGTFTFCRL